MNKSSVTYSPFHSLKPCEVNKHSLCFITLFYEKIGLIVYPVYVLASQGIYLVSMPASLFLQETSLFFLSCLLLFCMYFVTLEVVSSFSFFCLMKEKVSQIQLTQLCIRQSFLFARKSQQTGKYREGGNLDGCQRFSKGIVEIIEGNPSNHPGMCGPKGKNYREVINLRLHFR